MSTTRESVADQERIASLEHQLSEASAGTATLFDELQAIMADLDRSHATFLACLQESGRTLDRLRRAVGLKPVGGRLLRSKRLRKKAGALRRP